MNNGQTGSAGIAPWFDSKAPGGKAILDKCKYRAHLTQSDIGER